MEQLVGCAFTGHRENKLNMHWESDADKWAEIRRLIAKSVLDVYTMGIHHFICGMAHGCDLCFAQAVLDVKASHPDITLEAAIPFSGQSDGWSANIRAEYDSLLKQCDVVTVLQTRYTRDCMMNRNKYMVDRAAVLIAVYNGSAGGTRNTILYAIRNDVKLVEVELDKIFKTKANAKRTGCDETVI